VSPATVSGAWKQLRSYRMVTGSRRNGVWVQGDQTTLRPIRYEGQGNFGGSTLADLRTASPDPALLPDLTQALIHAARTPDLNSYQRERITPSLKEAIADQWAYDAPAFIATNGGYDAVYLALVSSVLAGAYVAVEDPSTVRILDILDKVGARSIGVESDDEGPLPESLAASLQRRPSVFLFQPGTHATTGRRISKRRLTALASVLKNTEALILEDDGLGAIASEPPMSLGRWFPDRTIHIRSFSKSHGPDLRLAVMSGPEKIIDQIGTYRNFREGWTSRILQNAAAWMLRDEQSIASVERARLTYGERRQALSDALTERGVPHTGGSLAVWIAVPSEQHALVTLASRGIAVIAGGLSQIRGTPHIRVATGRLVDKYDLVADAVLACLHDRGIQEPTGFDY
jgi:DNA-binding transcriptional MocR family regulator